MGFKVLYFVLFSCLCYFPASGVVRINNNNDVTEIGNTSMDSTSIGMNNHTDCTKVTISTEFSESNGTNCSVLKPFCYLLLGDWGKGGLYGDYSAKPESIEVQPSFHDDDFTTSSSVVTMKQGNSYTYQAAVGRAMATFAVENNPAPSAVVALGDNFYDYGVKSSTDSLWTSLWTDVYMPYSSLNIPWYAVLGNHDYGYGQQGVQAQIDRTWLDTDGASTWVMPATNYTQRFDIPSGGYVQIVFIDTTTLAPSENKCCNSKG